MCGHHEQFSWRDYSPETPEESLLSSIRRRWVQFCNDYKISDPEAGFKNYFQYETKFLKYLKKRYFCDDTTSGYYQRFLACLAKKDLGATDEELASVLGQLLDNLQTSPPISYRGHGVHSHRPAHDPEAFESLAAAGHSCYSVWD